MVEVDDDDVEVGVEVVVEPTEVVGSVDGTPDDVEAAMEPEPELQPAAPDQKQGGDRQAPPRTLTARYAPVRRTSA